MRETNEQVQAKQQLSDEELQRTQVLNLDDFKEIARIEKITSKKPAIIVAILGFVSITLGTAFPFMQSLNARRELENDSTVEARRETKLKAKQDKMTCTSTALNNPDGTDTIYEVNYTFENNELVSAKKTYTMTVTPGSTKGEARVKAFQSALPPFLTEKSGYSTSVEPLKNGLRTKAEINYELLNLTEVPAITQSIFIFKVDYPAKTSKEEIKEASEKLNYICK